MSLVYRYLFVIVLLVLSACATPISIEIDQVWYKMAPYDRAINCIVGIEIDYHTGGRDSPGRYMVDYRVIFTPENGEEIELVYTDFPVPAEDAADNKVFGSDQTLYIYDLPRGDYVVTVIATFKDRTHRPLKSVTKSIRPTIQDWQARMYGPTIGCK